MMSAEQGGAGPRRVLVAIPTYNERENIDPIVGRLRAAVPAADILVVDDNSPDGTGRARRRAGRRRRRVHVLHRTGKEGLGAAYLAGFAWGLERGYDALVEMDADGSHQPEQLPELLARSPTGRPRPRLALGARRAVVNWPRSRRLLSRGGNLYARLALGVPLARRDRRLPGVPRGGAAAHRSRRRRVPGYCFQIDLVWRAVQRGLRVVEVPITFVERVRGESKMSQRIVREAMLRVTVWGFERLRNSLPGRRVGGASG